ncbi:MULTISPECIES: hypothetical protein [unclassified Staphylococcus]|uniref:hypothetical protein n=1 Tax=unclassified Staphylococcus TaxID=91994 RepID=UPI001AEBB0C6|nr:MULTISPECIES: hypothetical protein [unclassified Staphylococcus]
MEYDVLVGYCAGVIDENARSGVHSDIKKQFYDELSLSELTNYFYFIEIERPISEFMYDIANFLMEISDAYSFDEDRQLIVFNFNLLGEGMEKYKGFDNLLSACLSIIENDVSETYELGINGVVYSYSDFEKEFPEEFRKFDFISEYNFMEMFNHYIIYEMPTLDKAAFNFDDENGTITVYFSRLH